MSKLNRELVTCTEIEVNGKFFDVWSDDEALLKDRPAPNLYIYDDLIIFGSVAFAKANWQGFLATTFICFGTSPSSGSLNCSRSSREGDELKLS